MARVAGRSLWIAWPIGVICGAVVVALVWLAAPGVPGAIEFTGNLLRSSTSAPVADGEEQRGAAAEPITDCRSLYPDRLWSELVWTPDVLLTQTFAPPATTTALVTALAPSVRLTCGWRAEGGARSISTTLATVPADSGPIAQASLTAEGFTCAAETDAVHCERTRGDVSEIHDLRGDLWVSSVLTGWAPEGYGPQVASRAFPG
ncbi:hypothetical protein ACTU3I_13895 [Microbacterium sp. RD1]|uniref:hypothetical protein n=1 Tax=Microbacterium sp. RD1 TaxID=3457313 RepID=UPI003FA5C1E9